MITNRDFGLEYAELKKKKIPQRLNLGITLRDKKGYIITEWTQNFDLRKGGIVDGIQVYVLDGRFLCFLAEEIVQLIAKEEQEDADKRWRRIRASVSGGSDSGEHRGEAVSVRDPESDRPKRKEE